MNASETDSDTGPRPPTPPPTPRWVKALGIVALVLLALFVMSHLAGVGLGRHG